MFNQGDAIRDYIFPIATAENNDGKRKIKRILGTAFFIGNNGFALTAKHVIKEFTDENLIGIFSNNTNWLAYEIISFEVHPTEDVAIIKLIENNWNSIFTLSNSNENSSCKYRLFGYPDDTTYELINGSSCLIRPDLVYNEGYIRRRYSGSLPQIKGNSFYELSEVAGSGASGAPVCKIVRANKWPVIGIYVGEKINERATSVSYAVREESFCKWTPKILGKTITEES